MRRLLLISYLFVLLSSCGGGSSRSQEYDFYKEAYEMGKKQGFTASNQYMYDHLHEASSVNGWWINYFHFQPPSTPEEKANYQKFEQGWKDGVDEGYKLSK